MKPEINPTKPFAVSQQLNDVGFRVILIPFLGIAIPLLTRMVPHEQLSLWQVKLSYLYTIGVAFIIWQGNRYLLFTLRSYFNWFNHPMRKVGALLLVIPFYTVPISVLLLTGWYHLFLQGHVNWNVVMESSLIILVAVVFIVHVYETVFLVKESEKEMLLNAQLERARTEAALQALKNQIDPHFIFNSLNTLSHLIMSSPAKARRFNDSMADVYRYILHNKERNLVLLQEELQFLENYFDLLKIRFEEGLDLQNTLPPAIAAQFLLPPISLQLLMENAIKHNEFSARLPLRIKIFLRGNILVFSNRMQQKSSEKDSNGIGLANLQERYKLVTGKQIAIFMEDDYFTVELPLLTLD